MQWHGQNKLGALVMSVVLVQAEGEQSSQYFGYRHTALVLELLDKPVYRWLVDRQCNAAVEAKMLAHAVSAKFGIAMSRKAAMVAMGPLPDEGVLASCAKIQRAPTASSANDTASRQECELNII